MGKIILIIFGLAGVTAGFINLNGLVELGYFSGKGLFVGMDEYVQDTRKAADPAPVPVLPSRGDR